MKLPLIAAVALLLIVGTVALLSFQSAPTPQFAPDVKAGALVTFFGGDFSTRTLVVKDRRADLVACVPTPGQIAADSERLVVAAMSASFTDFRFASIDEWKAKANGLRVEAQAMIDKGNQWLELKNGPERTAREKIAEGTATIDRLDRVQRTADESYELCLKQMTGSYATNPIWVNLREVAGYRIEPE